MENTTASIPVTPQRPVLFTILGILSLIGGCLKLFAVLLGGSLLLLVLSKAGLFSVGFLVIVLGLITGVLLVIQGIGFLKMKKWLPSFLVVTFLVFLVSTILSYGDSAGSEGLGSKVISIAISGAVVWLTYQQKAIFKN